MRLGLKRRRDFLLAWETVFPELALLPVIAQTFDITEFPFRPLGQTWSIPTRSVQFK